MFCLLHILYFGYFCSAANGSILAIVVMTVKAVVMVVVTPAAVVTLQWVRIWGAR